MTHTDDTGSATKGDLTILAQILYKEFKDLRTELLGKIHDEGEETRRYFDVSLEVFRDDITGAFSDRTAQFEEKIDKLKYRVRAIERKMEHTT